MAKQIAPAAQAAQAAQAAPAAPAAQAAMLQAFTNALRGMARSKGEQTLEAVGMAYGLLETGVPQSALLAAMPAKLISRTEGKYLDVLFRADMVELKGAVEATLPHATPERVLGKVIAAVKSAVTVRPFHAFIKF